MWLLYQSRHHHIKRGHHPKPLVVVLIAFYWRQILRYVLVTLNYLKKCMISMALFKELSIKICFKFDEFKATRICFKCFFFIFTINYFFILFLVDSYNVKSTCTCAVPESFVRGGQTLASFFFSFIFCRCGRGKSIQNYYKRAIIGP